MTRAAETRKNAKADTYGAKLLKNKNPLISQKLSDRIEKYNSSLQKAMELQKEGKCLIIAPKDCCNVGTLKKRPKALICYTEAVMTKRKKSRSF